MSGRDAHEPSSAVPALRVVVVDNDPDALELVVTDLALEGYEIVGHARDGVSAFEVCLREAPDVLVVDYRIGEPNGVEVTRAVRERLPDTSVVVYSNYPSARLERDVSDAGGELVAKGNLRRLRRAVLANRRRGPE